MVHHKVAEVGCDGHHKVAEVGSDGHHAQQKHMWQTVDHRAHGRHVGRG